MCITFGISLVRSIIISDVMIYAGARYVEAYRSGHNGPDSKSGSPQGLVGSNPTASVSA